VVAELARRLTRLHHSGPATGESEDWYKVPVSVMNEALAALEQSAGHTAEECEADALQAEYEALERRAGRVEAALRNVIEDCEAIDNDLDSDVTVSRGVIDEAAAALAAVEPVDPADMERLKALWKLKHAGEPNFDYRAPGEVSGDG